MSPPLALFSTLNGHRMDTTRLARLVQENQLLIHKGSD